MSALHFYITAIWFCVVCVFSFPADAQCSVPANAQPLEAATANGLAPAQAESVVAQLRKSFGPRRQEQALLDEVAKLSEAEPRNAPGVAAAATAIVFDEDFAVQVAETAAKTARSQAPAIAAAVSTVFPGKAPKIAARVASTVPSSTLRITRIVAYTVPQSVEGVSVPPRRSRGLESSVIVAVRSIRPSSVYGAAHFGARKAAREGRYSLD